MDGTVRRLKKVPFQSFGKKTGKTKIGEPLSKQDHRMEGNTQVIWSAFD